ncbi:MAG TPA: VCBS repeat-containing protein, partial [Chloroflexota bacterium]|nr:VCBS repeat-containing protein [Chloroflexota bacterium]
ADFNGDGKPDIAAANYSSNSTSVLLGNGNGSFQAQKTFVTGISPFSITAADVNRDGRTDLLVASFGSANVGVLSGDPPPYAISITRSTPGGAANGATSLSFAVRFSAPVTGVDASDFQVLKTGTVTTNLTPVVTGSNALYTVTVQGVSGQGTLSLGMFDDGSIHDVYGNPLAENTVALSVSQTFSAGSGLMASADVNGDGRSDLVIGSYSTPVTIALGNGNGTFSSAAAQGLGPMPYAVSMADMNGDGIADIETFDAPRPFSQPYSFLSKTISIALGNGDGTYRTPQTFNVGRWGTSIATADVNGDGRPDVIAGLYGYNAVAVLLGNGDGTLQASKTFVAGGPVNCVATGDFNGDGKLDIVTANPSDSTLGILLGNGDGTFQAVQTLSGYAGAGAIAVADLNGDGKLDLVATQENGQSLSVFLGNGNATFKAPAFYATGHKARAVAVADLNGDGKPDLIASDSADNTVTWLPGNGDGTFALQNSFAVANPSSILVGDFNRDGRPDIAVNSSSSSVQILTNQQGSPPPTESYTIGPSTYVVRKLGQLGTNLT